MKSSILYIFLLLLLNKSYSQNLLQIDTSFGNNGFALNPNSSLYNQFFDITISPNQTIYCTGIIASSAVSTLVARFDNQGNSINFGSNGYSSFGNNFDHFFSTKIQLDQNNKVLVGGFTADQGYNITNNWIYRLDTTGIVDTSFANNGHFFNNFGSTGYNFIRDIKILSNGKIIALAKLYDTLTGDSKSFIFRLNTTGKIDSSFGNNGLAFLTNYPYIDLYSCLVQNDGKILVAGQNYNLSADVFVGRYNANGSVDNTFGINGGTSVEYNSAHEVATNIQIQSDGKIVYSGTSADVTTSAQNIIVGRLFINGTIDSSYNAIGYNIVDFKGIDNICNKSKISTTFDELYIVGSNKDTGDISKIFITKFKNTGKLDSTISPNGYIEINTNGNSEGNSIDIDDVGKILLAGFNISTNSESVLLRMQMHFPTSIIDYMENKLIKVHPNPSNSVVKIELQKNIHSELLLTDIKGNLVYRDFFTKNTEINTSQLANGIYNLSVLNEEGKQTQKIIIQH